MNKLNNSPPIFYQLVLQFGLCDHFQIHLNLPAESFRKSFHTIHGDIYQEFQLAQCCF